MRRLQDLAVSADPSDDVWNDAAEHAEALADQLAPFTAPEGQAPAGRSPQLPGMGSLLLPPWTMSRYDPDGVEMRGHFTRFHVGGNGAVHGGVLPLLFDHVFGMVVHAAARPISRTGFLHVDYRKITPIDTPLIGPGSRRRDRGPQGVCPRRTARRRHAAGRGQRPDGAAAARPAVGLRTAATSVTRAAHLSLSSVTRGEGGTGG